MLPLDEGYRFSGPRLVPRATQSQQRGLNTVAAAPTTATRHGARQDSLWLTPALRLSAFGFRRRWGQVPLSFREIRFRRFILSVGHAIYLSHEKEERALPDLARLRPTRHISIPTMLDSSACSRVSLLVVALGLICTCCNSFVMRPAGPHSSSSLGQHPVRGVSRLATEGAVRATRMMAGDVDVRLVCLLLQKEPDILFYPVAHPAHLARICHVLASLQPDTAFVRAL